MILVLKINLILNTLEIKDISKFNKPQYYYLEYINMTPDNYSHVVI